MCPASKAGNSYYTLIAAHARAAGLILITNNVREFERVPGLRIENWAQDDVS